MSISYKSSLFGNQICLLGVVLNSTAQIHNKPAMMERNTLILSRERQVNEFGRRCKHIISISFFTINFLKAFLYNIRKC